MTGRAAYRQAAVQFLRAEFRVRVIVLEANLFPAQYRASLVSPRIGLLVVAP
jgi:hypothetical protein